MTAAPGVSVVIPARNEAQRITGMLDRLFDCVRPDCEVLVVLDAGDDPTAPPVQRYACYEPRLACLVSGYGAGAANAIRYGIDAASAPVVVVTMADGCDDPAAVNTLARLVEGGAVVAAASRYAAGGAQHGGPLVKGMLSRAAGYSLAVLARVGTRDATNSYKAYSAAFVRAAGIDTRRGFAAGIELTAKARRLRLPVAEIPTRWQGRPGPSGFRVLWWLPEYLHWYAFAFGRPLTIGRLRSAAGRPESAPAVPAPGGSTTAVPAPRARAGCPQDRAGATQERHDPAAAARRRT